jgi:Uma2 family endonuclease
MMQLEQRLWTVEDYSRMIEAGILQPEDKVELIEGQIVQMAAKGTAHEATVTRTARVLRNSLGERVLIRTEAPIQLDNRSEPEPDVAAVRVDSLDYADHHPTPEEIYLVIEVADTTLAKDCGSKARAYAGAGIADYWVLDVNDRRLHVFREASQTGYQSEVVLGEDATVEPLSFPSLSLPVNQMLPPKLPAENS